MFDWCCSAIELPICYNCAVVAVQSLSCTSKTMRLIEVNPVVLGWRSTTYCIITSYIALRSKHRDKLVPLNHHHQVGYIHHFIVLHGHHIFLIIMYELYGVEFSGNSLKIRMMLGFLGLQYKQQISPPALKPLGENLLVVNPRGLVPVLVDGDTIVCESNAILVYLSLQMCSEDWDPLSDARQSDRVDLVCITDSLLWTNRFSWDIPVAYEVALGRSRNVVLSYLATPR